MNEDDIAETYGQCVWLVEWTPKGASRSEPYLIFANQEALLEDFNNPETHLLIDSDSCIFATDTGMYHASPWPVHGLK